MGKKKNWNGLSLNAEGVRRGRVQKARGVSMQLDGLGQCCKLPQAAKRHLVHFGLKMLYLLRPSLAKTYAS